MTKAFWDERYSKDDYVYGEAPNEYLRGQLLKLSPGKILFPAEGEGRNAVFAATKGWQVSAFDQSTEGKRKAELLAAKRNVAIDYRGGEFSEMQYDPNKFDVIALIYAHFSAETKSAYHKILSGFLKPGGIIIFEAFSKNHLKYNSAGEKVGGPKDIGMLFSIAEIESDFADFEVIELCETLVELNEGPQHSGRGSVIRFVGRKKPAA